MKQKSKKIILLFIISLVMILGFTTMVNAATLSLSKTTLELEVGKTETLTCTGAEDGTTINWKSSDEAIATINETGLINAIKEGTTTITATVGEDMATCTVTVKTASSAGQEETVQWTDFSNAVYEMKNSTRITVDLYIKNVKSISGRFYYYCITDKNQKPDIKTTANGYINVSNEKWQNLSKDNDGNFIIYNMEEYVQLNQDMYLWIVEFAHTNDDIPWKSQYSVLGQKLERPKYPVYAEMFFATHLTNDSTQLVFNLPTGKETKRNFTLKIGKITDKDILNGIKNNNGESWNSLLEYAKKSNAIFNKKLTTPKKMSPSYESGDGAELINLNLDNKAYYYMYVVFDDENGKYYPATGLTIAQASSYDDGEWYLIFLGDDKFKWDDFGTVQTGTATIDGTKTETTTKKTTTSSSPSKLPYTGTTAIGLLIVVMVGTAVFFKVKNNKYKGI